MDKILETLNKKSNDLKIEILVAKENLLRYEKELSNTEGQIAMINYISSLRQENKTEQ